MSQRVPLRVVILGGGYGGVYAAIELKKAARRRQVTVSLVSRDNFFLFQPMLAEVVAGTIEPAHIINSIRRLCPSVDFYHAEIEAIDTESRQVIIVQPGRAEYRSIPYDHLVIAVGSSTDLSAMPGMAEHAFPFKTLGDAIHLRNHIISVLELAEVEDDPGQKSELLTFVVAGAGYTGVEVAAEIHDFVREAARSYRHVDPREVKVILLQGRHRILPELSDELAAFSHRLLERRGIEIRLDTLIEGATPQSAILKGGDIVPTRTLVAAIGSAANRLLDTLPCPRDSRGRVIVDETLSIPGYSGLWAIGDCAAVPDIRGGGTCPPTAQYAFRQARHVARNILADIRGARLGPFSHRALGVFVPLSQFSAAAQVLNLKVSGPVAWLLYRTYYLYQLPRLKRKLQVLIDWNLALVFHRDIVYHDISRSDRSFRAHFEPGQYIYRQGEFAQSFYIILDGSVEVLRSQNGEAISVASLGTGEYFGEMSLLRGVRHSASVKAVTQVDLMVISGTEFTAMAASSTRISELVAGVMRQRSSPGDTDETPSLEG